MSVEERGRKRGRVISPSTPDARIPVLHRFMFGLLLDLEVRIEATKKRKKRSNQ